MARSGCQSNSRLPRWYGSASVGRIGLHRPFQNADLLGLERKHDVDTARSEHALGSGRLVGLSPSRAARSAMW